MLVFVSPTFGQDAAPPADPSPSTAPATAPAEPSPATLVVDIVSGTDATVRRQAAIKILRMGSPEGVAALLSIFNKPNNHAAKQAVCEALAEVGTAAPEFRDPLLALLDDRNPGLREAAIRALAIYRDDPEVELRLRDVEHQLLLQLFARQCRQLYELLPGDEQRAAQMKQWLGSGRAKVREIAIDIVHQDLKKKQVEPADTVLPVIRAMIDDPAQAVRLRVVALLRDLRKVEAGDARLLEARVAREPSSVVRELIYHALGQMRDPESIPVCVKGLADPVDTVAAKAAGALASLAEVVKRASTPPELKPAVAGLLARAREGLSNDQLRQNVIEAMAAIGDKKFLGVLVDHADGEEALPAVRQAALRGIGRIGDPSQVDLVIQRFGAEKDPPIREAAMEAVGRLGSHLEHLQVVQQYLDPGTEASEAVRKKAWEAYREIFKRLAPADQPRAIETWPDEAIRLLDDAQLEPTLRQDVAKRLIAAARKLGKSDPQAALDRLDKLAKAVPAERIGNGWADELAQARQELRLATRPAETKPAN